MKKRVRRVGRKALHRGKGVEKSKEKHKGNKDINEKQTSDINLPKVFLRVYPYASEKFIAKEGCIKFKSPKVISFTDRKDENRVHYCHYSQIFGAFTPQKYVLHSSGLDPLQCFLEGGSSVMFFQAERMFCYHTTIGNASDSGIVPKVFGLIFDTLEGFLPKECEFKLSRDSGKIKQLTSEERESERILRDKVFFTKKQRKPEPSCVSPSFREALVIDFGRNFMWASSFAIVDNNIYDLFEAFCTDGPPSPVLNWQDKNAGEFPLSYLCQNVHVLVKTEAMQLFLIAKENYEKCISEKYFDPKRALFIYCLANLRFKKKKDTGKVVAHSFGIIIFPALSSSGKPHNSLDNTLNYIASTTTVMRQLKEAPRRQPKPMPKCNLLGCFLQNIWFRKRCISMIINLRIDSCEYRDIVMLLKKSCLKRVSINCVDVDDVLHLKILQQLKEPKTIMQKGSLADDVSLNISLKWKRMQEEAKNFDSDELKEYNVTLGPKSPFLEVYFVLDLNQRRRIVFPQLNSWFVENFDADVQEIRFLKVKVLILKLLDSVLEDLRDGCKNDFDTAKDICTKVKTQLVECGKLDEVQKENVLSMIHKQIDGLVCGHMCFRTLEEMVYLQEIIENDFQYI